MKHIIWLASYPKSGNTWFRAFLANLLSDADTPVDINALDTGPISSARMPLDEVLGYDSSDLTHDEVDRLRPALYARLAERASPERPLFVKVHDAYSELPDGRPLFPPAVSIGVIYLVRNPLDVCVSLSHHAGRSEYQKTVEVMNQKDHCLAGRPGHRSAQLRQRTCDWSGHVRSWIDAPGHTVHVVRYEDMKSRPLETFTAAAWAFSLPADQDRIRKAIRFSSFEELKKQEMAHGFRERLHADREFFRKGKIGSGRETLSAGQIAQLSSCHAEVMAQFGYADPLVAATTAELSVPQC